MACCWHDAYSEFLAFTSAPLSSHAAKEPSSSVSFDDGDSDTAWERTDTAERDFLETMMAMCCAAPSSRLKNVGAKLQVGSASACSDADDSHARSVHELRCCFRNRTEIWFKL
jgi:hypothetical protein